MKNIYLNRIIAIVLIPAILNSCNYYKLKWADLSKSQPKELVSKKSFSVIAVHAGNKIWQINDPIITQQTISGTPSTISTEAFVLYQTLLKRSSTSIREIDKPYANQLHLFVDELAYADGKIIIPFNQIKEIQTVDKDYGLKTLAIITGTLGTLSIGFIIFLAISCGCPHNYVYDGNQYIYNNTLFTGALASNLERNDFKILPDLNQDARTYEMMVKNEENEIQFTNLIELISIKHSNNVNVYASQNGEFFTISDLKSPKKLTNDNQDILNYLAANNDDVGYQFDLVSPDQFSYLFASFEKPSDVSNPKIVLKLRNTMWGGFVFKEFKQLFGNRYADWVKKNHERSKEEAIESVRSTGISLEVSLKIDGKWTALDYIDLIGEVSYNTVVIPVDTHLLTESEIEIRLKCGYMFWDVDFIGMDFSPQEIIDIQYIKPSIAKGFRDFNAELAHDDDQYMQHDPNSEDTYIKFDSLPVPNGESRSLFLHSKGYYLSLDIIEGKTNWSKLKMLTAPGGFSKFSKELHSKYINNVTFKIAN